MVILWVNIEDDKYIVYYIGDEELENIDDLSAMDIYAYETDYEEEDISLKEQKYTHLEAMEEMYFMIYYMMENAFPL